MAYVFVVLKFSHVAVFHARLVALPLFMVYALSIFDVVLFLSCLTGAKSDIR